MGSSRQRRRARTSTESSSVRHAAEVHTPEDVPSPSSLSFLSLKNKEVDTAGSHLVTVSKVITVYFSLYLYIMAWSVKSNSFWYRCDSVLKGLKHVFSVF
jgi:hypothetical protein